MIYFYYGTNIDKALRKTHELIDSLQAKKPEASFFKMDSENFNISQLQEYIGGQGLFSNKHIVFLDRLCEKKEIREDFIDKLKDISESKNIFIILEGKLDRATATKIEKKAEKFILFELEEKISKSVYDPFSLANAFGKRNKKETWFLYRKAIDSGEVPEAIHGMIFWKIKMMISNSIFVIYKKEELLDLARKLIIVYHDSRRGINELETGLESIILSL